LIFLSNFNTKQLLMKTIFRVFSFFVLSFLCSSSAWVNLTLMRPALINLPQDIQTLIIVDRSGASDKKQNKIEEIITGETMSQDAQAAQQAIDGVINTVEGAPRFKIIRTTEKYTGDNSGKIFPEALTWATIDKLCIKYKADAVLAIETFDSDFMITNGTRMVTQTTKEGLPIKLPQIYAEGVGTVNMGFRLYDPGSRTIADQHLFSHQMRWDATATSITEAVAGILNKIEAINQVSYEAGQQYALRITPTYYRVTRYFYNRPKRIDKLMEGVRRSEVADWEGAISSWKEAMNDAKKSKHKGRIALNIAVGYEVLGDMNQALEWASKAYTDYGEEMARDYVSDLKARLREEEVVKEQLKQ
jgi:hypothetical protein